MDKENNSQKNSGQMLCDYMYNPKSKVTYEMICDQVKREKFEKFMNAPFNEKIKTIGRWIYESI